MVFNVSLRDSLKGWEDEPVGRGHGKWAPNDGRSFGGRHKVDVASQGSSLVNILSTSFPHASLERTYTKGERDECSRQLSQGRDEPPHLSLPEDIVRSSGPNASQLISTKRVTAFLDPLVTVLEQLVRRGRDLAVVRVEVGVAHEEEVQRDKIRELAIVVEYGASGVDVGRWAQRGSSLRGGGELGRRDARRWEVWRRTLRLFCRVLNVCEPPSGLKKLATEYGSCWPAAALSCSKYRSSIRAAARPSWSVRVASGGAGRGACVALRLLAVDDSSQAADVG